MLAVLRPVPANASVATALLPRSTSLALPLVLLALAACGGGGGGAAAPSREAVRCGGEERVPLSCESEFKYEGRKIEGGFSALGFGSAQAKTDEQALRQIDQETERYAAQARRLCDEYNACVVDRDTYAVRAENLRRRMSKAPELFDQVKGAPEGDARRKALATAYSELVPDEVRRELTLDFSVEAQRPGEGAPRPVRPSEALATGTRVAFVVRPSRPAHVYLFQKSPDGTISVLFPDARLPLQNPIANGTALRLPPGGAAYKLNDKDIGTERVYLVASLDPLPNLDDAARRAGAGAAQAPALRQVARVSEAPKPGCQRALELDVAPQAEGCTRTRGLELDDPSGGSSFRARTEAADSVIVQTFAFEHVK